MKTLKRKFEPGVVKKDYSKVAWIYDFWSMLTESRAEKKVLDYAGINGNKKVLDVAVGTGRLFKKIVLMNKNGFTHGIDISPRMLEHARKKMFGFEDENFLLKEGNAYQLEYDEKHFDVLINNYMLDLLPEEDIEKILGEFYRVLKPGGKLIVSAMAAGKNWNNRLWRKISEKFPRLMTNCRPISPASYIKNAGFENLESEYITQNSFPTVVIKAEKH